jgi:undecaprenyl-diphosphatase
MTRNAAWLGGSFLGVALFCLWSYVHLDPQLPFCFLSLPHGLVRAFKVVTRLGSSTWILVGSALLFVLTRYVRRAPRAAERFLFIFAAVAVSGLVTDVLKWVCGRHRPEMLVQHARYGFEWFHGLHKQTSFPSGHANTITAFALALTLLYPRYWGLFVPLALLVSASRVVLRQHFLSDVVFGAYLAVVTTLFLKRVFERRSTGLFARAPGLSHEPPGDACP